MRTIKFRAWHKTGKKMLLPLSGVLWGQAVVPTDYLQGVFDFYLPKDTSYFSDGEMTHLSDVELMQFTGLLDAKGREIYEGDILQETFMNKILEWSRWQVGYESGTFGVYRPPDAGEVEPVFQPFYGFEGLGRFSVIGNIYENPELLHNQSTIPPA